jgi:hypothetical protein
MGQSLAAAFYVAGIFPEVAGDLGPSLVKRFACMTSCARSTGVEA